MFCSLVCSLCMNCNYSGYCSVLYVLYAVLCEFFFAVSGNVLFRSLLCSLCMNCNQSGCFVLSGKKLFCSLCMICNLDWGKKLFCSHCHDYLSLVVRKPTFWFPTWSDTNQAVQLQKMARGLKIRRIALSM